MRRHQGDDWSLPRGFGRILKRHYYDRRGRRRLTSTWFIEYWVGGKKFREPTGSDDRDVAKAKLIEKLHSIGRGLPPGMRADLVTFEELARGIEKDYERKKNRSGKRLKQHLGHLRAFFGRSPAMSMTSERFTDYVLARRADGAAEGTINRELAAAKRMFKVALRNRILLSDHVPYIELAPEDNIRHGLITPGQMAELLKHPGDQQRRVAEFAYITGWRADSDVLTRQWVHVQWERGIVELWTGEGKARKARKFPLFPRLRAILERQREWTDREEARLGVTIPWVFHNRGGRLTTYVRWWRSACAGLAKRHPDWGCDDWIRHRMRYSAVENLLAMGIQALDICDMVGMSMATLKRYHKLPEARLVRTGMMMEEWFAQQVTAQRVLTFRG